MQKRLYFKYTGKYLASIIENSLIMCDRIIDVEETKTVTTNFNKKTTCKTQSFYILIAFLLITIAFLIAVILYCYLIRYQVKEKDLLPFYFTNSTLTI